MLIQSGARSFRVLSLAAAFLAKSDEFCNTVSQRTLEPEFIRSN
jgi:hypothetical protein